MSTSHAVRTRAAASLVVAAISAIVGTGCFVTALLPIEDETTVMTGTDSAGAVIELTTQKGGTSNARVSDVVLGAAEAEVTRTVGRLTFTITFPAGVSITYTAETPDHADGVPDVIEGTWVQHAGGIFGEDAGDWTVTRSAQAE